MPLDNPNPVVVPPTTEKVYDKTWVVGLGVEAMDPAKPVRARLRLRPAAQTDSGYETVLGHDTLVRVMDLYALAGLRPSAAAALQAVFAFVDDLQHNPPTEAEAAVLAVFPDTAEARTAHTRLVHLANFPRPAHPRNGLQELP